MRETKFRGKVIGEFNELEALGIIDENGWVVGNLIQNGDHPMIVGDLVEIDDEYIVHDWWVSVIPESVGQYTGLKDKNGIEIYEGTVLKYDAPSKYKNLQTKHLVSFSDGRFDWKNDDYVLCHSTINYKEGYVVYGNIHDNPELLEVAK
ncbi:YopX family protein [Carnobacterium maltaromaticum]|uniref:YopX family protein n=1 Tax=Carnobacterium maltaromaticum TaxID=2751 RepID=UPI00026C8783|nr:YopX family protein [Carnobacterium maltaromaticum]